MWRPFEKVSTAARRWTSRIPLCTLLVLRSLVPSMRFITFDDPVRRSRIGALAPDGRIVDLNSACALYLRDVENEGAYDRLSGALVPPNMRKLFAGGDTSLEAARKAFDYVLGNDSLPAAESPSSTRRRKSYSRLRFYPKSFFIRPATSANTMRRPRRPGFRTRSCRGLCSSRTLTPSSAMTSR